VGLVWWLPLCRNPNIGGKFNLRGLLWGLFGGFLYAATLTLAENLTCAACCGACLAASSMPQPQHWQKI